METRQNGAASARASSLSFLKGKTVLITGGTGSFGQACVRRLLRDSRVSKLIIFSRDELKQSQMAETLPDDRLRFFLGDIRDLQRLQRAFAGVDYVIHAAALKQVPTLEYNPFEAVQTNILGAENIINAAIDRGVKRVITLSTDKAVNPVNLYGATKLCFEKLFVAGNTYTGAAETRFAIVRYGNVVGSRGSVVPLFLSQRSSGQLTITDDRMTRFWISLDQGVSIVLTALERLLGGEIFVPRIPSMRVTDLAKAIAPGCKIRYIGIRPGEKLHETLLTEEEAARSLDYGGYFLVKPQFRWWAAERDWEGGKPLPEGFRYSSDANTEWLSPERLRALAGDLPAAPPSAVRA